MSSVGFESYQEIARSILFRSKVPPPVGVIVIVSGELNPKMRLLVPLLLGLEPSHTYARPDVSTVNVSP